MLMQLFQDAFHEFLGRERDNIRANISERNLCGRLMLYLDGARLRYGLENYYTDAEYNRNYGEIKRVRHTRTKSNIITCDLILHSRGQMAEDNLIAIEMKKKFHPEASKKADRNRLIALTRTEEAALRLSRRTDHVYGYQLGLFIEIDTEEPAYLLETYEHGARVDKHQSPF